MKNIYWRKLKYDYEGHFYFILYVIWIVYLMTTTASGAMLPANYEQPAQGHFKLDHVEKYMRLNQVAVTGRDHENAFSIYVGSKEPGYLFACKSQSEARALFHYLANLNGEYQNLYAFKNLLLVIPQGTPLKISRHYRDLLYNFK